MSQQFLLQQGINPQAGQELTPQNPYKSSGTEGDNDETDPQKKKKKKNQLEMDLQESLINLDQIDGLVHHSSIKKIAELVDRFPDESVAIVRGWMYGA